MVFSSFFLQSAYWELRRFLHVILNIRVSFCLAYYFVFVLCHFPRSPSTSSPSVIAFFRKNYSRSLYYICRAFQTCHLVRFPHRMFPFGDGSILLTAPGYTMCRPPITIRHKDEIERKLTSPGPVIYITALTTTTTLRSNLSPITLYNTTE